MSKRTIDDYHKLSGKYLDNSRGFERRFVITGASGWLGRATLELLKNVSREFPNNITCFGSSKKVIQLLDGTKVSQFKLSDLESYPKQEADYLINFAFLTKEKSIKLTKKEFLETNRFLSSFISQQALRIEVPNILTMSSGGVYSQDKDLVKSINEDLYGFLKLEEESLFLGLSNLGRKVIIPRLFNVSGPHVYKHDLYMLPSLVYQAIKGDEMIIHSQTKVYRSFVSLAELMSVVLGSFEGLEMGEGLVFDASGTEVVEIGELALKVKQLLLSEAEIIRGELNEEADNRYLGSTKEYMDLIRELKISSNSLKDQILCTALYLKMIIDEE